MFGSFKPFTLMSVEFLSRQSKNDQGRVTQVEMNANSFVTLSCDLDEPSLSKGIYISVITLTLTHTAVLV